MSKDGRQKSIFRENLEPPLTSLSFSALGGISDASLRKICPTGLVGVDYHYPVITEGAREAKQLPKATQPESG
jgi:hypothetical protein